MIKEGKYLLLHLSEDVDLFFNFLLLFCLVENRNPQSVKLMEDWRKKEAQSRHIKRRTKLPTISTPAPFISSLPPSRRHYHSERVTCYTPTVLLFNSCVKIKPSYIQKAKKTFDIWTTAFRWGSLSPNLSLYSCFSTHGCHLIWLDVSLDCWDPGFTKKLSSTTRHTGLKFWGNTLKKMCLTSHIFKHSQNNTELRGRHSALGATAMLHGKNLLASQKSLEQTCSRGVELFKNIGCNYYGCGTDE